MGDDAGDGGRHRGAVQWGLVGLLVAVGVVVSTWAVEVASSDRALAERTVTATATVRGPSDRARSVDVVFTAADGSVEHRSVRSVDGPGHVGDRLVVRYDPHDPGNVVREQDFQDGMPDWPLLIPFVLVAGDAPPPRGGPGGGR